MPPRYVYWTILIDGKPTAFRAQQKDELLPTFRQLQRTNKDVAIRWFAQGRVWDSPEAARAKLDRNDRGNRRGTGGRAGGAHKPPGRPFGKSGRPPSRPRDDRPRASRRVTHVVLMKPRPDLSAAERQALAAAFERAIRTIPTVRDVRAGRRVKHGAGYENRVPDAADYIILIDFDDLRGLQAYLNHPAHHELGERFNRSLDASLVYDFELGPVQDLISS